MLNLLFILLAGGCAVVDIPHSDISNSADSVYIGHVPAGVWPKLAIESPEEERILLHAQSVLFHFGHVTGSSDLSCGGFTTGPRFHSHWPIGWYVLLSSEPLTEDRTLKLSGEASPLRPSWARSQASDQAIVIVLDAQDYPTIDSLYLAAEHKVEELRHEGARKIIVMRRGQTDRSPLSPPLEDSPERNSQLVFWIAQGELNILFKRDFDDDGVSFAAKFSLENPQPFYVGPSPAWSDRLE
jgi:hypothetical protein